MSRTSSVMRSSTTHRRWTMASTTDAEVLRLGLGKEAHMPEVDAEQRCLAAACALRRAQDGAVAAEHDDDVGVVGGVLVGGHHVNRRVQPGAAEGGEVVAVLVGHGDLDARVGQRPSHGREHVARLGAARVDHEQDPPRGLDAHEGPSSTARAIARSRPLAGEPGDRLVPHPAARGHREPQEVLDVAARPGQRAGRHALARPAPALPRRRPHRAPRTRAGGGRARRRRPRPPGRPRTAASP